MFLSPLRNYSACATNQAIQNPNAASSDLGIHPVIHLIQQLRTTITDLTSEKAGLESANQLLSTGISSLHSGKATISDVLQEKLTALEGLEADLAETMEQHACSVDQLASSKADLGEKLKQKQALIELSEIHNEAMDKVHHDFKHFYLKLHSDLTVPFRKLLQSGKLPEPAANLSASDIKGLKLWFAIVAETVRYKGSTLDDLITRAYNSTLLRDLAVTLNGNDSDAIIQPVIKRHQDTCNDLWTALDKHVSRELLLLRKKDETPEILMRKERLTLIENSLRLPHRLTERKNITPYKTELLSEGIRAAWTTLIQDDEISRMIYDNTQPLVRSTNELEEILTQKSSLAVQIEEAMQDVRLQKKHLDVISDCKSSLDKEIVSLKAKLSDTQEACNHQADKELLSNYQRLEQIKLQMAQALKTLAWTPHNPTGIITQQALDRVIERHIVNQQTLQTRLSTPYSTIPAASTYENELAFVKDLEESVLPSLLSLEIKAAPIQLSIPHRTFIPGHTLRIDSHTSTGYRQTPVSETAVAFEALPSANSRPTATYRVITHLYPRSR